MLARFTLPILALVLGAAAAVALVSCGGRDEKGLLAGETASEIVANLEAVEELTAAGDCSSAAVAVADVQEQIAALPESVDRQLRERLDQGADRLADVVNEPGACEETTTEETTTDETTTEETTTDETTTTTRPDKTQTTTTTPTTPTTTTSTAPTTTTPATGGTPGAGGVTVPPGDDDG